MQLAQADAESPRRETLRRRSFGGQNRKEHHFELEVQREKRDQVLNLPRSQR
jgi:hypothetical protein